MALSIAQINKLKQENAELKVLSEELGKIIECKNGTIATLAKTRDELKAENERLKALLDVLEEDNRKLSKENDVFYNNSLQQVKEDLVKRIWNLQTENKELAHYLACMTEQRNKANTLLQEIKEIAKEWITDYCSLDCFYDKEGCCICHENKVCYSYRLLKAITKAEEE